jgi:galactose mutarotase-like enzyme
MKFERSKRGPFETIVGRSDDGGAEIEVAPERGGLLTRLRVRGVELLALDEGTFLDRAKNVRGGIPICFPIAGRLPGDRAEFDGKPIHLTQHGFARGSAWTAVEEGDQLALSLTSSDSTRALFPFDFEMRVAFRLLGVSLSVESSVTNAGSVDMPIHVGFHPYFHVPASVKGSARIEAAATRAFDNRTGRAEAYAAPALGGEEVDLQILDPRGGAVRLVAPGRPTIRLDYGGFPVVVVWTQPGKDFVCVEPWSAPGGALAAGAARRLAPGATDWRTWFVEAEL